MWLTAGMKQRSFLCQLFPAFQLSRAPTNCPLVSKDDLSPPQIQLDLAYSNLFWIPRYFEIKTIFLGFAFQSYTIGYFKLPLFRTIFCTPWEFVIVGFSCMYLHNFTDLDFKLKQPVPFENEKLDYLKKYIKLHPAHWLPGFQSTLADL